MFTGIVEELGRVVHVQALADGDGAATRLRVRGPVVAADAALGDSIAVNGVCLTVVANDDGVFAADVMAETLGRCSLRTVGADCPVNLERAVRASDRLGGHLVQGHVDSTAPVVAVTPAEHWTVLRVGLPATLARYVVEKGSIAVDGVSLTVSAVGPSAFEVSLVPTTLTRTTLGAVRPGDLVNLEVDVTAKYVEKLLQAGVRPAASAQEAW